MRSVLGLAMSIAVLPAASLGGLDPRAFAAPAPEVASAAPTAPGAARPDPTRLVADDCARARKAGKTCELTLTPEDVGGETPGPDDIAVGILRFGHESSLVHVRHDFIVEIVRSAEDP